jgi:ribose transport system permease protein
MTQSMSTKLLAVFPIIVFACLFVYLGVQSATFFSLGTFELIAKQAVPTVIVALGLATVVIAGGDDVVAGGIDLSIPATAIICAAIIADQLTNQGNSLVFAMTLAFGAAAIIGAINAFLVVGLRMTPLLATLAMSVAIVGVTKVITSSRRIGVTDETIIFIRDGDIFGIAASVVMTAVLVVIFYHALHRTKWGMNMQATGGSRDAAEISGILTRRFVVQSFLIAAFAGWIASVFVLARGSGSSPGTEENMLLEMVLATFLGAAFSPRRVVTLWGAVLGAVVVSALSVGFISIGVNVFWTGCIKGGLILLVVASAAVTSKGRS